MKRRDDPNQILIDWSNPATTAATPSEDAADHKAEVAAPAVPLSSSPTDAGSSNGRTAEFDSANRGSNPCPATTPLRLPWDFGTTFPQPAEDAIDAGILDPSDIEPENVKALHEQHAADALAILKAIDQVKEARSRGIDPRTGKRPSTHAAREKLRRSLEQEPERLERSFSMAMGTYANAFGEEAADAFARYLRARHEGIQVIGDPIPPAPEIRKLRAIMPVPKPLEEAVEKGHFGDSENGLIDPSPDEVRAITNHLAENLIDWMTGLREVEKLLRAPVCTDRARLYHEKDRIVGQIGSGLAMYSEDFGPQAAAQLRAYASHQASKQQMGR